jgi:hypothetical protein
MIKSVIIVMFLFTAGDKDVTPYMNDVPASLMTCDFNCKYKCVEAAKDCFSRANSTEDQLQCKTDLCGCVNNCGCYMGDCE